VISLPKSPYIHRIYVLIWFWPALIIGVTPLSCSSQPRAWISFTQTGEENQKRVKIEHHNAHFSAACVPFSKSENGAQNGVLKEHSTHAPAIACQHATITPELVKTTRSKIASTGHNVAATFLMARSSTSTSPAVAGSGCTCEDAW